MGDAEYINASSQLLFPIIKEYQPELIIVSCGFDSAINDPLGGIGVTPVGYSWMTQGLQKICDKVLVVLEGGYNLESIANSTEAIINTLLTHPDNEPKYNELLVELGCENGTTYESLEKSSLEQPK